VTALAVNGDEIGAFVLGLRAQGVRDLPLLRAMEQVPRGIFAPRRFADLARADVAVPLPCGQTMTMPGVVAQMITALRLTDGQHVLELGTGSGYVTALLAHMGGQVTSLERYQTLALAAHERLEGLHIKAELQHADGLAVGRQHAQFDRILVNGVVDVLPEGLLSRLETGGRLVGAIRVDGLARLVSVQKGVDGRLDHQLGVAIRLTPLVAGVSQAL
jgi:protein-L-isoaspartate(D-aspartate) O-methyltransferase